MSKYVTDYVELLRALGADRFGREIIHPVLVLQGVAGTLRDQQRPGTVVTDLSETLKLSRLVGRVFELVKGRDSPPGPILVGRGSDCDVAIPDYSISTRHCQFILGGRDTRVVDLASTNGTFKDGVQLPARQPVPLQGGETLVFGRFAFHFFRPTGFFEFLLQQP